MTPTPAPTPDTDLTLLALADGELDAAARADAEARAAADPAAGELLRDLEATGPANRELWAAAEPPSPTHARWQVVRDGIAAKLAPSAKPAPGRWRTARYWLAGVCAAVAVTLFVLRLGGFFPKLSVPPQEPPPAVAVDLRLPESADPLAEFGVLPIATADDVMVSALRDDRAFRLVSCDHPLPPRMPLATADDLADVRANGAQMFTPLTPDDAPLPAVPSPPADK